MPPPPLRRQRPPLTERSSSQKNALGIRVVPYSPPPPDHRPDPASQSTSSYLSPGRADDAFGDHEASQAQYSSDRPGSTPSPSPPTLFGVSPTSRGVAVSESATSFQSCATPSINPHTYSSDNSNVNAHSPPSQQDGPTSSSPSSPNQRPWSRRRNVISLHPDKTFSLVPHHGQTQPDRGRDSRSPRLSYSTTSVVSDLFTDDPTPSSPLTTLPEHDRSISPICTRTPSLASTPTPTVAAAPAAAPADLSPPSSSPWNYRIVGGLRKVPKTPDLKKTSFAGVASPAASEQTEGPTPPPAVLPPHRSESSSLRSIHTPSTTSETTNYKVYESTSPHEPTTSIPSSPQEEPNYHILGETPSPSPSLHTGEPPTSPESSVNYVVYGESSPVSSSPVRAVRRTVHWDYSQESLVVPPLRPRRKPSTERLRAYKPISRESLRRTASVKSISSIFSQEATQSVLLAAPAVACLRGVPQAFPSILQDKRSKSSHASLSISATPHMNPYPHQWSSQLSTVASEGEGGSNPASCSLSSVSRQTRRSSGVLPSRGRNMLGISSSPDDRSLSHSRSPSDSVDNLQVTLKRPGQREIRDLDEHGDGLTDLYALQSRPSRNFSGLFSVPSDRNLQSSSSSRANSLTSLSLPSWARLYYGSGERKLLTYSSQSTLSEATESRRASFFRSDSPSAEHAASQLHPQRQRPGASKRQKGGSGARQDSPEPGAVHDYRPDGFLRRQTSSLWSPHLRHDHRASRYSVWEPPPEAWCDDGPLLGRRNIQVALFVIGFVFPFAWMIGACLPLPHNPQPDMEEGDSSTSQLDVRSSCPQHSTLPQELHYEGTRWWRRLNRYMSIVGLLVIGAIIALVVIGVRQRWGS